MSAYDDESKLTGTDNKEYLIPIISIDRWYTVCDEIRNFINYGKVEATPENPDSGTGCIREALHRIPENVCKA